MIVLGLTGSIGMGKSATARLFAEVGAAVWDADAAVHELYGPGGAAVAAVRAAFPGVTGPGVADESGIDRARLAEALARDEGSFARLEAIVHPLVREHRQRFLDAAREGGADLAVLDIPLLFETGGEAQVDAVVVVSAPLEVQRARVLARPGMTEARFEQILARQTSDAEKRRRADFIVDTGHGHEHARRRVREIVDQVLAPGWKRLPRPDEAAQ